MGVATSTRRRVLAFVVPALALAVACSGALSTGTSARAATSATASGAWTLTSTTPNPDRNATPASYQSLSVAAGHVTWTYSDGIPPFSAAYDATYGPLPKQLVSGERYAVDATITGQITARGTSRFTNGAVVVVYSRTWNDTVGINQSCWAKSAIDSTLLCDAPATKTGQLFFTVPFGSTLDEGFDVTVTMLNCGACAVRYHYAYDPHATPTTGGSSTSNPKPTATTLPEEGRLPVILLPGVAGTALNSVGTSVTSEVWPFAPLGGRDALALDDDGETPTNGGEIEVGDILRGGSLLHDQANFYGPMLDYLEEQGYEEDVDLFTFPYDWRLDNADHFADLDDVIATALEESGQDKVVLLAHSMGGLIAREYILSSRSRAATVDSLISMGTPYWGSPKVFYAFVKGYDFGNSTVLYTDFMKQVVQHFPAAYQLLPQFKFVHDMSIPGAEDLVPLGVTWLLQYPGVEWSPKWLTYQETDVAWSMDTNLVKLAATFHRPGGTPTVPKRLAGVKQYVIVGTGTSTLSGYLMEDVASSTLATADGRSVRFEPMLADGDGTVPLEGLRIKGATGTYYLPTTEGDSTAHGALPASARVQALVGRIVAGRPPNPGSYTYSEARELVVVENLDYTLE